MTEHVISIDAIKQQLATRGRGYCTAKFTQMSLHLATGTTHSCCLSPPHHIDPSTLHQPHSMFNTPELRTARSEMLAGKLTNDCNYCWRVERNGSTSERYLKSGESWAHSQWQQLENYSGQNIVPTYLEVDFSNVCNYRCSYCGPEYSSTWVDDLKRNGPIVLLDGTADVRWAQGWQKLDQIAYANRDDNPYTTAFWQWFPELYSQLQVFRITGGEPLLSKHTYRVMQWLIDNPNPQLEFAVNTNLGAPEKLWDQFVDLAAQLVARGSVKKLTVFTSIDGWGERAEYTRWGLNTDQFRQRYIELLELGNIRVTTICTYNILSATSMRDLLEWQLQLRRTYNRDHTVHPAHRAVVGLDISYLQHPEYLDSTIATDDILREWEQPALHYIAANLNDPAQAYESGFRQVELEKFKRILVNRTQRPPSSSTLNKHRAMFYDFVNDQDRRNGTRFLDVFPEMTEFYNICKSLRGAR